MLIKKIFVFCIIIPLAILEALTVVNPKKAYVIGEKDSEDEINENGSASPVLERILGGVGFIVICTLFYWIITM